MLFEEIRAVLRAWDGKGAARRDVLARYRTRMEAVIAEKHQARRMEPMRRPIHPRHRC
jgi:hypothetical protein